MHADQGPAATDFATIGFFALASAAAVALGSLGLVLHGSAPDTWLRNPAAWAVGMFSGGLLILGGRSRSRSLSAGALALTIAALAGSLFAQNQAGVHRWIDIGPLHVNVAALLLPVAIVALATPHVSVPLLLAIAAAIGALLLAQPDASQASAFLLAAASILCRRRATPTLKVSGLVAMAAVGIAAWLRFDPLEPVPEVEGIFPLLWGVSWALAMAAALALAATCVAPLRSWFTSADGRRDAGLALTIYFTAIAVTPLLGAYPVPLVGLGMSFPVGYWLGTALLCARLPPAR